MGNRSAAAPASDLAEIAERVCSVVHEMDRVGLTVGTAGNVSARTRAGDIVLTPTALAYPSMTPEDLVVVDLEGKPKSGSRVPTTELDLHLACLRRHPEIGAVVHTHAIHASMFAVAGVPIPCALEEFEYYVGGDVLVTPYHRTGTRALGDAVAERLYDRAATLIAHHGLVVVGRSVEEALTLTILVERAAQIVWGRGNCENPIRSRKRSVRNSRRAISERRRAGLAA